MDNLYDLGTAIVRTSGAQQAIWKAHFKTLMMEDIHRYADAASALPFSSRELDAQLQNVLCAIDMALRLVPEHEKTE
jgi:hypothetical protein